MAKVAVGVRVEEALIERLRNAIWHLGQGRTITSVLSIALKEELLRLEAQNGGKPFPLRRQKSQALKELLPRKPPRRPR